MPDHRIVDLSELDEGLVGGADAVVVIDVVRAFTTAAVALAGGARGIVPVQTVEDAFGVAARLDGALVVGEVGGHPVDGFDLPNSPVAMETASVAGRVLVHRTTSGTQGLARAARARRLLAASFVCAAATAAATRDCDRVVHVVTGSHSPDRGDEDRALAEYLVELGSAGRADVRPYLDRAAGSAAARRFTPGGDLAAYADDIPRCLTVDRYGFAMRTTVADDGLLWVRASPA